MPEEEPREVPTREIEVRLNTENL